MIVISGERACIIHPIVQITGYLTLILPASCKLPIFLVITPSVKQTDVETRNNQWYGADMILLMVRVVYCFVYYAIAVKSGKY